jgi:outer membrane protein
MSNKILLIIILLPFLNINGFCQKDTLTLKKCIEIALEKNPQIKIAEGNYGASEANLKSNQSVLYPQVSFQTNFVKNGGIVFIGPFTRDANYSNYSLGFQLSQLIYDFGKTYSQISSNSNLRNASEQQIFGIRQDIILSTQIAYYKNLQTIRKRDVAREIVKQDEEHLKQAKAIYDVGKSPQYDVIKANADLANARVNLISAENDVRLSKLQLANSLNTKLPDDLTLSDNLEFKQDSINLSFAFDYASKNRPEIIAGK